VSIIEVLFRDIPDDKEDGYILSNEYDRTQNETVSPLFNLLWSWLIDEDGRNVLWNGDNSERYPGFELYSIIAKKVKYAIPREQLNKDVFADFICGESGTFVAPAGEKVYSLFC
jgi:hypothetical protein